jgi:DNA-binding response OmpR family regulator
MILLDVVLPDIMGTKVCRQIKSDPFFEGTFVILISGVKTASRHQTDGLDTGADGYIARPVSNRELIARVNAMVRILMGERDRLHKKITKKKYRPGCAS